MNQSIQSCDFIAVIDEIDNPNLQQVGRKILEIENIFSREDILDTSVIENSPDVIDDQMIDVGKIVGPYLCLLFKSICIKINLSTSIHKSIQISETGLIRRLLDRNIDLYRIYPKFITTCIEHNQDELIRESANKIRHLHPVQVDCLCFLAAEGKLSLIKILIDVCKIPSVVKPFILTYKICSSAIQHNRVDILRHFLPPSVFPSIPVTIFEFLICSIKYDASVEIISYFVENGISIRQRDYLCVKLAIINNRIDLLIYFTMIDPTTRSFLERNVQTTKSNN